MAAAHPRSLPTDDLYRIIEAVQAAFGIAPGAEVTLEANPGVDERGDPVAQAAAGITRLSIGAQSFAPGELKRLGRRHSPSDIGLALIAAREAGIGSINLDLLYDVPGQTLGSWADNLERAIALGPDHLSLYALTLDDPDAEGLTGPGGDHLAPTAGARRWRDRARPEQDEDRAAAMYHVAGQRLTEAGLRGYELSNWATPGHESRHNLGYWERRPIEAVGPGAHAFDGRVRRWNAARLDLYLAALQPSDGGPPTLPPGGEEPIDAVTAAAETVILGPAPRPRRAPDRAPRAALRGCLRLGRVDRPGRGDRRRPSATDDARTPPLERAVRPPDLSLRPLTCCGPWRYDAGIALALC